MRILASLTPRRLAAHATIAVLVGTGTAAAVALAGSGGGRPLADSGPIPAVNTALAPNPIALAASVALDRLVANGTIDQAQADTIEQQVEAGSLDPPVLIDAGTVNQGQMQAVAEALAQVKRSTSSLGLGLRSGRPSEEKKERAAQKAKLGAETMKDGGAPAGYGSGTP